MSKTHHRVAQSSTEFKSLMKRGLTQIFTKGNKFCVNPRFIG